MKIRIAAVLACISMSACAAEPPSQPNYVEKNDATPPAVPALSIERDGEGKFIAIRIHNDTGKVVAILWPSGKVEVLDGTPDESAARFWAALSSYVKACSKL